ncbi:NfeD family protein [Sulfolobus acidocaldarius]|uniref:Conserved Archaeal membrane protein n=4 Tax=Sulfolobus acidocaldarius TaxID=2285 RepID=Q4J6G7_SULAC|nr:NfeD family protein [Sulfolobus acidocaldarius]AAY81614.1 conserved Archaeal membrane protein [Sulfolobus acidocaldarius DSM 639]AGE72217.1 hypothetical protein SacN8_11365 [Sulfolobus acidocaldarius N8]AGE74534.1 hypothetical protein SacRon12I_11610 [Sulfolobus acidocaldarius Ron12/I]ALU29616.1 serine protease [Sulfolobus acidocaldarius]ALU32349.1 serine protease [Sulfolobus acidocaldarius]
MVVHDPVSIIIIVVVILALILTGQYANPIVAIPSLALVGFLLYRVVNVIWTTRRRNLYTYEGKIGRAVDDISPGKEGYVLIEGEYWRAISNEPISKGDEVIVIGMQNLKLIVKKYIRVRG